MVSKEINSIATPDAFSTGIGQRMMVSKEINSSSTPDAFSTGIGQRKMVSIENTQFSLLMHSPLGCDKERWYL